MKRIILIACFVLSVAIPLFGQDEEQPKVKLPDAVMEQVVNRIVTWYFRAPSKPKTLYFAAENIKKEWLPEISNIEFVLLEKNEFNSYGRSVYFFREVEKSGKYFEIGFGYGEPYCNAIGDPWAFGVAESRVRLWQVNGGWGSGCASGSSRVSSGGGT